MRRLILAAVVLPLTACDGGPLSPPLAVQKGEVRAEDDGPMQPADALRPDDLSLIEAAVSHLASDKEAFGATGSPNVVLHHHTTGGSAFVRADQVKGDCRDRRPPEDALRDLETRNNAPPVTVGGATFSSVRREAAPLDGLRPLDAHVLVRDLDQVSGQYRWDYDLAFRKAFPTAKGYARASLPGYTADGRRALVRLSFGPTAHGAHATYLMEKGRDGRWQVLWRELAYYA